MQGRLRQEPVSVEITTRCSHCEQALHLTIDSEMRISVREPQAQPLAFMPDVDWETFKEPNIIHAY